MKDLYKSSAAVNTVAINILERDNTYKMQINYAFVGNDHVSDLFKHLYRMQHF